MFIVLSVLNDMFLVVVMLAKRHQNVLSFVINLGQQVFMKTVQLIYKF